MRTILAVAVLLACVGCGGGDSGDAGWRVEGYKPAGTDMLLDRAHATAPCDLPWSGVIRTGEGMANGMEWNPPSEPVITLGAREGDRVYNTNMAEEVGAYVWAACAAPPGELDAWVLALRDYVTP